MVSTEKRFAAQVNADAKGKRIKFLVAHTPFKYQATHYQDEVAVTRDFSVVFLAVYVNRAGDFAEGLPDFEQFLSRVQLPKKEPETQSPSPSSDWDD